MTVVQLQAPASTIPVVDVLAEARVAAWTSLEAFLAGASSLIARSPIGEDHVELIHASTLFDDALERCGLMQSNGRDQRAVIAASIAAASALVTTFLELELPETGDLLMIDELVALARDQVATLWTFA